ncbi:hypothetical protein GWI33_008764 [Rhynchophorus ferrugineus]|uniref:Uncharacterized protein n=1 Tax=Rhynchophorus ferrugineus TaxID=354439 RepID=A0A834IGB0_RHYFE|nr:hypothetical protein GWI33_008764 [Rhynchophorus ferrugineus]
MIPSMFKCDHQHCRYYLYNCKDLEQDIKESASTSLLIKNILTLNSSYELLSIHFCSIGSILRFSEDIDIPEDISAAVITAASKTA